jgi:hypothetical protein
VKTLELLALLSPKEKKQFERTVIKIHKRARLVELYRYLNKHSTIDKEKLFAKVFGCQYHSKQDNLLRNELRLLNKEIELFLIDIEWLKEQHTHPERAQLLLLQSYFDREQTHLFEQQWRKLYKKAQQEQRYSLLIELLDLYFDYHVRYSNVEFDSYQQLATLIEEGLHACAAQLQEQTKYFELRYGFIQRNLWALQSGQYTMKKAPIFFDATAPLENEALVHFLADSNEGSYYTNGEEKIELLQKALAQSESLKNHPRYGELRERIQNLQASLALEYYILKRYEEADRIYQTLVQSPIVGNIRTQIGITFNYFTNLLGLEAYERAVEWYQQQKELWANIEPIAYKGQYMVCWAYHQLGQHETALDLLVDHNIQERSEADFAYARLLLSITYHALQEQELAEREVYNLLQNTRYRTFKEHISVSYAKFIHQYFLAIHTLAPEKRNAKIEQTRQELEEMYRSNLSFSSTFLYRWLIQHLKAAIL